MGEADALNDSVDPTTSTDLDGVRAFSTSP